MNPKDRGPDSKRRVSGIQWTPSECSLRAGRYASRYPPPGLLIRISLAWSPGEGNLGSRGLARRGLASVSPPRRPLTALRKSWRPRASDQRLPTRTGTPGASDAPNCGPQAHSDRRRAPRLTSQAAEPGTHRRPRLRTTAPPGPAPQLRRLRRRSQRLQAFILRRRTNYRGWCRGK